MACTCDEKSDALVKTYLIDTSQGEIQIDIPESWKVTYGPVAIGAKSYGGDHYALRIYETDTKQRAIFTNVRSFRDMSIPIRRKVISESGSSDWERTEDGSSSSTSTQRVAEWVTE